MQVATKICPGCNIEKSLDDFGKKGEGKQPLCKPCHNAKNKAYKNKTAILKPRDSNAALLLKEEKIKCRDCEKIKQISEFYKDNKSLTGYCKICKECDSIRHLNTRKKLVSRTDEEILKDCKKKHPDDFKSCTTCKENLKIDHFSNDRARIDGLNSICKKCNAKKLAKQYVKLVDIRRKAKIGMCCEECGYSNPLALEFAHLERKDKYRNNSGRTVGPGSITVTSLLLDELKKTRILCNMCHRLETERENITSRSEKTKAVETREKRAKFRAETCDLEKLRRGSCIDCGLKVNPNLLIAFDFDHLPQYEKITEISTMTHDPYNYTHQDVENEMKKCELRCCNCHRIKTAERREENIS